MDLLALLEYRYNGVIHQADLHFDPLTTPTARPVCRQDDFQSRKGGFAGVSASGADHYSFRERQPGHHRSPHDSEHIANVQAYRRALSQAVNLVKGPAMTQNVIVVACLFQIMKMRPVRYLRVAPNNGGKTGTDVLSLRKLPHILLLLFVGHWRGFRSSHPGKMRTTPLRSRSRRLPAGKASTQISETEETLKAPSI